MKELAVAGVVSRVQGSGTVVAQLHRLSSTLEIRDIHDEILARGHRHSTQVLKVEAVRADATQARFFQLRTGAKVFTRCWCILKMGGDSAGRPVCESDGGSRRPAG